MASTDYRWIRKRYGLWIPYRKRTYLYWFKCLQEAQQSDEYEVQWNRYKGWGGANAVLGMKFDGWWEDRWQDLFAVKERGQDSVKFPLSTTRPKTDAIRTSLLAWQARNTPPDWTPRDYIAPDGFREQTTTKRKGGRTLAMARKMIQLDGNRKTITMMNINPDTADLEQEVQSRVGRYLRNAKKILTNVSEGRFP